ncbi:unnamed protein product [Clonostachys solani]|uniref:beta-glucosidase n=1 Tax=Clonostachys solani TaxID=160281 RepID=A0A9P0EFS2_9HYPO|nr:unnamed protein product [Clonostachys solani]
MAPHATEETSSGHLIENSISPNQSTIAQLIDALSLDEKCNLLSGANMWETHTIPRLGIQSLKTTDGPAGVRGSRWTDGTHTTQIPCGISLGATFNPEVVRRVGKILGSETKRKRAHVLLAPTMNISRSPFGGRNFENFGEDPFLTGTLASAYIDGVQSEGVGACMKHYVANDQETRRFNMDEKIDERTLREIYLKPFHMALSVNPWTAMTAYPKVNGEHVDMSQHLVKNILREEWGYNNLAMSDWGGLNDTVKSILATTDLEMPGPPLRYGRALKDAVINGDVSEKCHINPSVERLLKLLAKAGRLQGPGAAVTEDHSSEATRCEEDEEEFDDPKTRQTVREAAGEGIVLLKNDSGALPLAPASLKKLAIIGPNAKYPTTGGTGSAIVNPYYVTNPYQSIKDASKSINPDLEVLYERGILTHLQPPLLGDCLVAPDTKQPGMQVDFFDSDRFEGPVVATTNWHDSLVYFMSDGDVPLSLRGTRYTYRATGILRPSVTGTYDFSFSSTGKAKLFIDGDLAIDNTEWTQISGNFMNCGSVEQFASRELEAGKSYVVSVDNLVVPPPTPAHDNTLFHKISGVRIGMLYRHDTDAMFRNAVTAASVADAAIVVVGHNNDTEREGSDRTSLALPGRTDELIRAVCAVNKYVVVVTQSACAISMPWAAEPAAIVHAWYQGQECGNAIADVILGAVNPSGKLPVSFPNRIEDHGSYEWFPGDAASDQAHYAEGVLVGYRWFDAKGLEPLWPFGFGLSYTSFAISNISIQGCIDASGSGTILITMTVMNVGRVQGSEVIQVYTSPSPVLKELGLSASPKSLASFIKIGLDAGESRQVQIPVQGDSFAWYAAEDGGTGRRGWRVDPGVYSCFIGTSSRHIVSEVSILIG